MPPAFWTIGCLTGAAAVATGAFGAHGLKKIITDPSKIRAWETAAHYQVTSHGRRDTPLLGPANNYRSFSTPASSLSPPLLPPGINSRRGC